MTDFPDLKVKALVSFPAKVLDGVGIDVVKQNGSYQFDLAYDDFAPPVSGISPGDAAHVNALLWNDLTGQYYLTPIALFGGAGGIPDAPSDGVLYGRKDAAWEPIPAATGGSNVTTSDTPPTGAEDGDLWWESDTGNLFVYYDDGTSTQWVQASGGGGGGIAEAPNDGQQYARQSLAWAPVVSGGATPSSANPLMDGIAAPGAATAYSRGDHVHPTDTSKASVSYVDNAVGNVAVPAPATVAPLADGAAAVGTATKYAREDHRHPTDTLLAPLASPTFTGDPKAPTPTAGDNDTSIATTAFVGAALGNAAVRYDAAQSLTDAQKVQARGNIYAAPFDALAYNGMQINGAMEVSQEFGTTASVSVSTGNTKYVVDGWQVGSVGSQVVTGAFVTSIVPPGYISSLQIWINTANAAPASGNYVVYSQRIEGYRVARLSWGTANAQSITLGFWVYGIRIGTYSGSVSNGAFNRSYAFTFTVNTSVTWEYKTVTIPGDTAGTWAKDNTAGMVVCIALMAAGTAVTTAGAWTAGGFFGATGTTNGVATTGDYMFLAGLTMHPGLDAPTAARSPFIVRPYDQELIVCQRLYNKIATPVLGNVLVPGICYSATLAILALKFFKMRSIPTISISALSDFAISFGSSQATVTGFAAYSTIESARVDCNVASGLIAGQAALLTIITSNAALMIDARLT